MTAATVPVPTVPVAATATTAAAATAVAGPPATPLPYATGDDPRPALSHDDAVATARAVAPQLAAYAAEADRLRTLPAEAVRLLDDARLFDVLTPRVWGGGGHGFATALLTTEELSRSCASAGWLRAVMGGNTWTVAQFPLEARQEVFAAPPAGSPSSSASPARPPSASRAAICCAGCGAASARASTTPTGSSPG